MKQLHPSKTIHLREKPNNNFLYHLYNLIEDNLNTSPINVGFLASQLSVSRSTLNRKLLILTGRSPHELIKIYRLQKAKSLLNSGKNVSETAYLSGFETPSYFIHCFKEAYKITPKEYSKSNFKSLL